MSTLTGYLTGGKATAVEAMEIHRQCVAKENKIAEAFKKANKVKPPLHDATPEQLAQARSYYGVRLRPLELNTLGEGEWAVMTRDLHRNAMFAGFHPKTMETWPPPMRVYDRVHNTDPSWAMKVKKDEQKNLVQYAINSRLDEDNREIPIFGNCEYGHRLHAPPEKFKRTSNVRIAVLKNSTYGTNGIPLGDRLKPT